jgi:hypothetical protein
MDHSRVRCQPGKPAHLPEIETGTSYGTPALKVRGKLFQRVKDPDTLVLMCPLEEKKLLMAAAPHIYYETDHCKGGPSLPTASREPGGSRRPSVSSHWMRTEGANPRQCRQSWSASGADHGNVCHKSVRVSQVRNGKLSRHCKSRDGERLRLRAKEGGVTPLTLLRLSEG